MYWVSSAVGALALALTLIGVYGVISYVVTQRRKEFGIRLALGAGSRELVTLVLRQSLRLALAGMGVGVVIALGVSSLFADVVIVNPFSAPGYVGGAGVVFGACLGAAYVPSRRAARVNPVDALRADS
jgi:ABC-type antimicrobial peptide transport system permease subunit